jgi:hypothetical protein
MSSISAAKSSLVTVSHVRANRNARRGGPCRGCSIVIHCTMIVKFVNALRRNKKWRHIALHYLPCSSRHRRSRRICTAPRGCCGGAGGACLRIRGDVSSLRNTAGPAASIHNRIPYRFHRDVRPTHFSCSATHCSACVKVHFDLKICVHRVQNTEMNVTRSLALPTQATPHCLCVCDCRVSSRTCRR